VYEEMARAVETTRNIAAVGREHILDGLPDLLLGLPAIAMGVTPLIAALTPGAD